MRNVPKTPIDNQSKRRLNKVVNDLVAYVALATAAYQLLMHERRLTPQSEFRMQVELTFATNLLKFSVGLSQSEVGKMMDNLRAQPNFADEVKKFADNMVPPKPALITPDQFAREVAAARGGQRGR